MTIVEKNEKINLLVANLKEYEWLKQQTFVSPQEKDLIEKFKFTTYSEILRIIQKIS